MSFLKNILKLYRFFIFNKKYSGFFKGQDFHYSFVCDNHNGLKFGKKVYIGPSCHFDAKGGIELRDYSIIAPHVKIWSYNHDFKSDMIPYGNEDILKKVVIGKGVWVGLGAIILPGTEIGEGCIIGAGSIVHGQIPPYSLVRPGYATTVPLDIEKRKNYFKREFY
ncbi:MAG: acyltransferase [Pseudoalteromonas sp.]|uniref:acyltransferase n=1 Tax=Pseudoalteromonas sp. TaxID=53249 RepID=UPI001DEC5C30|nr:acyltransferase [Pseudoalteromonas sp.]NRA80942.1 acyltransferase [Pseudoalteromonas sp.]|tara:strand:+ start:2607 stop:3101 length:495 start_codon:yes stop_codon:yes gene_type:complete